MGLKRRTYHGFNSKFKRASKKAWVKKIVLPEFEDSRVIEAAAAILKEGFCVPVLVGAEDKIQAAATAAGVSLEGAEIINPATFGELNKW